MTEETAYERVKKRAEARRVEMDRRYEELKALDKALFDECVQIATAIALNTIHFGVQMSDEDRRTKLASEIEGALITLALRFVPRRCKGCDFERSPKQLDDQGYCMVCPPPSKV